MFVSARACVCMRSTAFEGLSERVFVDVCVCVNRHKTDDDLKIDHTRSAARSSCRWSVCVCVVCALSLRCRADAARSSFSVDLPAPVKSKPRLSAYSFSNFAIFVCYQLIFSLFGSDNAGQIGVRVRLRSCVLASLNRTIPHMLVLFADRASCQTTMPLGPLTRGFIGRRVNRTTCHSARLVRSSRCPTHQSFSLLRSSVRSVRSVRAALRSLIRTAIRCRRPNYT